MKKTLAEVFGLKSDPKARGARTRVRPSLETLECRDLMAAGSIMFSAATDVISIQGSEYNDVARVTLDAANPDTAADDRVVVRLANVGPELVKIFPRFLVKHVTFSGLAGNDRFLNRTDITSKADGGLGHDELIGGSNADSFSGGAGLDRLFGMGGDDVLSGGADQDFLSGGAGKDYLNGGAGNDILDGGGDLKRDTMHGGPGADLFIIYRHKIGPLTVTEPESILDFNAAEGDKREFRILP